MPRETYSPLTGQVREPWLLVGNTCLRTKLFILFVLGPAPKPALISARLADARRRLVLQRHTAAISFDRRAAVLCLPRWTAGKSVSVCLFDGLWTSCSNHPTWPSSDVKLRRPDLVFSSTFEDGHRAYVKASLSTVARNLLDNVSFAFGAQ